MSAKRTNSSSRGVAHAASPPPVSDAPTNLTAQAVPFPLSFFLPNSSAAPPLTSLGLQTTCIFLPHKTKPSPEIEALMSAEPNGTACAVPAILGITDRGCLALAHRHRRLLLFVRFADRARWRRARVSIKSAKNLTASPYFVILLTFLPGCGELRLMVTNRSVAEK